MNSPFRCIDTGTPMTVARRDLHRARIVNRFLDFLVQEELIGSNPIADLRAECCVKSS